MSLRPIRAFVLVLAGASALAATPPALADARTPAAQNVASSSASGLTVRLAAIAAGRLTIAGSANPPGVSVRISGTAFRSVSDADGKFSFSVDYRTPDCRITLATSTATITVPISSCGRQIFLPRGAWSASATYALNDLVLDGGSTWRALKINKAKRPARTSTYWQLFAPAGATGAVGAPGPRGATGAKGTQGPEGEQGPAGPVVPGPVGPAGDVGLPGAEGPTGAPGDTGPRGSTGGQGLQGADGETGQAGDSGLSEGVVRRERLCSEETDYFVDDNSQVYCVATCAPDEIGLAASAIAVDKSNASVTDGQVPNVLAQSFGEGALQFSAAATATSSWQTSDWDVVIYCAPNDLLID